MYFHVQQCRSSKALVLSTSGHMRSSSTVVAIVMACFLIGDVMARHRLHEEFNRDGEFLPKNDILFVECTYFK